MAADEAKPAGERIAKVLARAGLCSRREAERWIEAGRVSVDGVVLPTPAFVVPAGAQVTVDGKAMSAPELGLRIGEDAELPAGRVGQGAQHGNPVRSEDVRQQRDAHGYG